MAGVAACQAWAPVSNSLQGFGGKDSCSQLFLGLEIAPLVPWETKRQGAREDCWLLRLGKGDPCILAKDCHVAVKVRRLYSETTLLYSYV